MTLRLTLCHAIYYVLLHATYYYYLYYLLLLPSATEKTVLLTVMVCVNRKYKRAASISKLILSLDDIVFIDTQVSRKVCLLDLVHNIRYCEGQGLG